MFMMHRKVKRSLQQPAQKKRPRLIRQRDERGHVVRMAVENIPYRLQVFTELPRASLPGFHQSSQRLVRLIESAGLKLELSCWEVKGDVVHFYNYWSMEEDANRLAFAELLLPDLPGFARFAKLWLRETKDLVVPINEVRREAVLEAGVQYVYVRACQEVPFAGISEFAARLEGSMIPFARANGWYLGDAYWPLTGPAGRVVQTWVVPEEDAMFSAQRLATAPWQSVVTGTPTYQVLEATPSDPLLGRYHWRSASARPPASGSQRAEAAQ